MRFLSITDCLLSVSPFFFRIKKSHHYSGTMLCGSDTNGVEVLLKA